MRFLMRSFDTFLNISYHQTLHDISTHCTGCNVSNCALVQSTSNNKSFH